MVDVQFDRFGGVLQKQKSTALIIYQNKHILTINRMHNDFGLLDAINIAQSKKNISYREIDVPHRTV